MNTMGFRYSIFAVLMFILISCSKQDAADVGPDVAPESARSVARSVKMVSDSTGAAVQGLTEISEPVAIGSKKYIALRHHLQIETAAEKMQASFDAALKHCEALSCQLLSANFNRETPYSPPSASLSVRVPPRNVAIFLSGLAKNGEVMQHGRDSEDKTNQVVDADARISNLTNLRDRLRLMLSDKTAKFKDIIEVERELANTQSELDSMTNVRKILALETDLVAVNIDFTAAQGITEQGFFAPVLRAFKNAGQVFMESIATVITFVMAAIPWLLIGIPIVWLVRRYWLKCTNK